jgi:hypothetical protein
VVDEADVRCVRCSKRRDPSASPAEALAWSAERISGELVWLCPGCARAHVRDIEGKLPIDFW